MRHVLCCVVLLAVVISGCAMAESGMAAKSVASLEAAPPPAVATPDAPAPASPAAPTPAATGPAAERIIIYNAGLCVVVSDIARSLEAVRGAAVSLGGYLQELEAAAIIVRVPASRFHEALSTFEKLGEVTQRHVKALDITEEMRDLKIRLENAESVRARLQQHLEKSMKMEDTIRLEAELERITQTIELLKGKIRYLASQAAFSTIRVQFNSPLPQKQMVAAIPFNWVRRLGDGLVTGTARGEPDTSRWRCKVVSLDLPPGYIKYYERDTLAEAMSADNILIKIQRHENYDGGDLLFWGKMARRALLENRAVALSRDEELATAGESKVRLLTGTKDLGGKANGYLLAIATTRRNVYTIEAWGPAPEFEKDQAALAKMVRSIDVD